MVERRWRIWASLVAVASWTGILMQFVSVAERTGSWLIALGRLSFFFTIISNLVVAIVYSLIALGQVRFRHPLLIAGLALTMLLVGVVFELLLRRMLHLTGWRILSNSLLHDAVPLLTAGAWLMLAEKGRLRARDPWIIALFPISYLIYALVRGRIQGIYPYPFLDVGRIGWGGVGLYVAAISAAFLICGQFMVWLDHRLARSGER